MVEGGTAAIQKGSQTLVAGDDAFEGIGTFDRLDAGHLLQFSENLLVNFPP